MKNTNCLETKKCGQCSHFLGLCDFGLACELIYYIVDADSDACSKFQERDCECICTDSAGK